MRLVLVSLLALACSAEPSFISYVPPLTEDGGAPSEPVTPPTSGTGGVAAGAGGTAGSAAGSGGIGAYGGQAGSSGTSGASGSAGTLTGSGARAGGAGAGQAGVAGTGEGGSSGKAGAPVGGAGSSGSSGSSAGTDPGEAGMGGAPEPEPDPEPKCRVRRMAPNDDQCLVREVPGCTQVAELIAPPHTCVWTSDLSRHDGCSSLSDALDCQPLCAGAEPITKLITFKLWTKAKIFLFEGRSIRCWDIETQSFGAPCDEVCDQAAQKHEAYVCGDVECIAQWDFEPACEEPIPVGDDQNSCS